MPEPVKPAEGTPAAEGAAAPEPKEEPKVEMHTIKIDGVERQVTTVEALELASKSAGAQAKFDEAAAMRTEASRGLRTLELMDAMDDSPSEADIKEFAAIMGVDAGELMAQQNEETPTPKADGTPAAAGAAPELSKEQVEQAMQQVLGMTPAEAKGVLTYSKQRHIRDAKAEIRETTDNAVEKDDVFGKIMVGKVKEDRAEVIKDLVAEDVLRRIQDGESYGTELVNASIQKVRASVTKFGIPSNPEVYPVSMGLSPGAGLPTEVTSAEPIKRVDAAEDKDEMNLVARMMQKQINANRNP